MFRHNAAWVLDRSQIRDEKQFPTILLYTIQLLESRVANAFIVFQRTFEQRRNKILTTVKIVFIYKISLMRYGALVDREKWGVLCAFGCAETRLRLRRFFKKR